ncbi:MAG: hypothetical protein KGH72_05250 [Candidatus Micrarchaeota archaeon]|nr:hypothetical protein [Candidatus Micrarchaeota archaeon]
MPQMQTDAPRKRIVAMDDRLGYLGARELVRDRGGLPSNVLLDDMLVNPWSFSPLPSGYFPARAREFLVYPARDGAFKRGLSRKGRDLVDARRDAEGREWVFPGSSIPKEALGRRNVGLFVDPQEIEVVQDRVVVIANPDSVIVIEHFIQSPAKSGLRDGVTRVPADELSGPMSYQDELSPDPRGVLYRSTGAGVRPIVRERAMTRDVDAQSGHEARLGVGFVSEY